MGTTFSRPKRRKSVFQENDTSKPQTGKFKLLLDNVFRITRNGKKTSGVGSKSLPGIEKRNKSKYSMFEDEAQQERLIQLHFLFKYFVGGNYLAPVQDVMSRPACITYETGAGTNFDSCRTSFSSSTMPLDRTNSKKSRTSNQSEDLHRKSSTQISQLASVDRKRSSTTLLNDEKRLSNNSMRVNWQKTYIPPRVLDIACGTGTWILEMATDFPETQFYGIDIHSDMYPSEIKPTNAVFQQANLLDGLKFPDAYFDYVHMSLVYNYLTKEEWQFTVSEIRRVLKPAGYVELREIDPVMHRSGPLMNRVMEEMGVVPCEQEDPSTAWYMHMGEFLKTQGDMTDIHNQVISIGFGDEGAVTDMMQSITISSMSCHQQELKAALNLTDMEYDTYVERVLNEANEYGSFNKYYTCWARKPMVDIGGVSKRESSIILSDSTVSPNPNTNPKHDSPVSAGKELLSDYPSNDMYQFAEGFVE